MRFIRSIIRWVIYSTFTIVAILLTIRLFLDIFGQGGNFSWFIDITDILLEPFAGVFKSIGLFGFSFNFTTLFAIFAYSMIAALLDQVITGFLYFDPRIIFIEFVASIFKIIENALFFRIIMKLFGANTNADFTKFVYDLSEWFLGPINNAFPPFNFWIGKVEGATIIILVLVMFIDILVESVLLTIFFVKRKSVTTTRTVATY